MTRWLRQLVGWAGAALVLALAGALLWGAASPRSLDLGAPVGALTGRRLAALGEDRPACLALLDRAGVRYTALPPRRERQCGYDDAIRFRAGGPLGLAFRPAGLGVACPVATGLAMWEWDAVQPAARRLLGTTVVAVEHFGSYSCRRLYGRDAGTWSEHATADAVDVAGFVLADGRRISVARDWPGNDAEARFLRAVRDGACGVFATVLSPDYNAAHRDHLHLDQAARGSTGWRACR